MATIYSKSGADAATAAAIDALNLGTAAAADAGDFATAAQGAKADASDVDQITLTGDLVLTVPAGFPAGQVYRVTLTQDGTGGHAVTYDGRPITVALQPEAVTSIELHPASSGRVVRYPGRADALRDTGALATLDLPRLRAAHAAGYLTTPTYDGSDQAVHPDVLVLERPWSGYRYWMAMTPYPGTVDTWENPSILASHDGETWVVPSGLTNPIDAPATGFFPDPCLVMDGQTLWCIYASKKAKWSTDGRTWSERITLTFGNSAGGTKLSPSVVHNAEGFHYWAVDTTAAPNVLYHGLGSTPSEYGPLGACTIVGGPAGRDLWHVAMREVRGGYVGAFVYCDLGTSGSSGRLHLATSPDGVTWTVGQEPMLAPDPTVPWASGAIYRSCLVPTDGVGGTWGRLWYSAYSGGGKQWRIGYTPLRVGDPESWPELARTDVLARHAQPIIVTGSDRNVLPDADLLRPASGNLVPLGWNNNLVGATGHAWYPEDESWSVVLSTTSTRAMDRTITLPLTQGDLWTFSAEARSAGAASMQQVQISYLDGSNVKIGSAAMSYTRASTWTRIAATLAVPAGAASINIIMGNVGDSANATRYWWRRAQLERSPSATRWTPGPTATLRLQGASTEPTTGPALNVYGKLTSTGSPLLMSITSHGAVALAKYTTATRPTAAAVGEGAIIYDDTLNLPIVSDGTTWRNFSGTAV